MAKIRNVNQSAQERTVIKTAPDIVVYLEGLPYLKNFYLTPDDSNPLLVNFNDHVVSFSASYDTDQQIPTCAIVLNVPAHLRYLYQAPGGNNVIKSMMQVQVFMKGYYFANDGNTLYHRVFKGFTSHISHGDDGKTLTINIQCQGILGLFQMMQIDLSPAIQSSSAMMTTPMKSVLANMSPYQQIAFAFLFPSFTEGFQVTTFISSLQQGKTNVIENSPYFNAIQDGFIAKWQTVLADICKETHIYGLQQNNIPDVIGFLQRIAQQGRYKGKASWSFLAAQEAVYSNIKVSDQATDIQNTGKIRRYLPDNGLGTIDLLNGRVVSRLEFVRTIAQLIEYEFYQDIDGQIIIKPPLWNLDVANLGSDTVSDANNTYQNAHPTNDITPFTNPFVANLDEVSNEIETEDQGAVRATRMIVQGNTSALEQFIQLPSLMRALSEFIDIPKLAQFGLREEPARTIPWLQDSEWAAVFAQAAAEVTRANKAYRTYSFTLPARPELKLGFPMYVPHRDMYGYVKSIGINYQQGGSATMSVTLDALRKRIMYPTRQTINGKAQIIFESQPNLVLKWTKGGTTTDNVQPNTVFQYSDANTSPANQIGAQMTLTKPQITGTTVTSPDAVIGVQQTEEQLKMLGYVQSQLGSYFSLSSDTTDSAWRIQQDSEHIWSANDPTNPNQVANFWRAVDADYYADIRTTIPYTDDKGYEVLAPFPWGRWVDLKTALQEFTRGGYIYQPVGNESDIKIVNGVNAFIFAGLGTPSLSQNDAATQLQKALSQIQSTLGVAPNSGANTNNRGTYAVTDLDANRDPVTGQVRNPNYLKPLKNTSGQAVANPVPDPVYTVTDITTFELDYSSDPISAASIMQGGQPDNKLDEALVVNYGNVEQQKVNMFVTGSLAQPDPALKTVVKAVGNKGYSAGQASPNQAPAITALTALP